MFVRMGCISLIWIIYVCSSLYSAQELDQKLTPLTDEIMHASFGMSSYHAKSMQSNICIFHDSGDTWNDTKLSEYCLTGIFQHYVYQICSLNMNTDYNAPQALKECDILAKAFIGVQDPDLGKNLSLLLNLILSNLKSNPLFVGIGVGFHKNKIILEKKEMELSKLLHIKQNYEAKLACCESDRYQTQLNYCVAKIAELSTFIYATDRICIDQQTCFYYWIKQTLDQTAEYFRGFYEEHKSLPEIVDGHFKIHDITDETIITEPEFLSWPTYKIVIEQAYLVKN